MPRHRTKGCLPVLLVILAVAVCGRVRQTPEREAPLPDVRASVPQAPPKQAETGKPVRPAPEGTQPAPHDHKLTVRVVGVHDGDTITVLTDDREQIKVRLDAIDAPELGQAYGQASKKTLSGLLFCKEVVVVAKKHDKYGRTVGHVIVEGQDVNLVMLEAGMAWHYKQYDHNKGVAAGRGRCEDRTQRTMGESQRDPALGVQEGTSPREVEVAIPPAS